MIPNKATFKFKFNDEELKENSSEQDVLSEISIPVYISKSDTVKELEKKICRMLSTYSFIILKNKNLIIKQIRLWKSNYEVKPLSTLKTLQELESKYGNFTNVKIDG